MKSRKGKGFSNGNKGNGGFPVGKDKRLEYRPVVKQQTNQIPVVFNAFEKLKGLDKNGRIHLIPSGTDERAETGKRKQENATKVCTEDGLVDVEELSDMEPDNDPVSVNENTERASTPVMNHFKCLV